MRWEAERRHENNVKPCINSSQRIKKVNKKENLHYLNEEEEVHR